VMLRHLPRIHQGYIDVEERIKREGGTPEERKALEMRLGMVEDLEHDYQLMEKAMVLLGRFVHKEAGEESVG